MSQPASVCAQCFVKGTESECAFTGTRSLVTPASGVHAAGPPCTFVATPEERARLVSVYHGLGADSLEGTPRLFS